MSKIEWTGETWNPTLGCTKVGRGCRGCYAIREANKLSHNPNPKIAGAYAGTVSADGRNWSGKLNLLPERLDAPLHWAQPRVVFVDSMSDLFHEAVPFEFVDMVMVVMWATKNLHKYQVLTKRAARMRAYFESWGTGAPEPGSEAGARWDRARRAVMALPDFPERWRERIGVMGAYVTFPLPNVIAGFSASNQAEFDAGWAELARTPLAARMVSLEPLCGPLRRGSGQAPDGSGEAALDWVIVGGESGPRSTGSGQAGADPMHPDWARGIRDQCVAAGVPFFFKQGSAANWPKYKAFDTFPDDLKIRQFPEMLK